jgi:DNA-binding GntR family transcriptional regulator
MLTMCQPEVDCSPRAFQAGEIHATNATSEDGAPVRAPASRGDQLVVVLREAIVSGQLAPNERLIEDDLAKEFGVSRGPVREALQRLEQEGLVESFPHRGTAVMDVSLDEIAKVLIPIRLILEEHAFLAVQGRLRESDVATLTACIKDMRSADVPRSVEADIQFHRTVLERANKPQGVLHPRGRACRWQRACR